MSNLSRPHELESIILTRIEEPAARKLFKLCEMGLIKQSDVKKFNVSAQKYKAAVFAQYDSFDVEVRDELLKSLLEDYQATINRLIDEIVGRSKSEQEISGPREIKNADQAKSASSAPPSLASTSAVPNITSDPNVTSDPAGHDKEPDSPVRSLDRGSDRRIRAALRRYMGIGFLKQKAEIPPQSIMNERQKIIFILIISMVFLFIFVLVIITTITFAK